MIPRSLLLRPGCLTAVVLLAVVSGCGGSDEPADTTEDNLFGTTNYTTPDENNAWMKGVNTAALQIGEEHVLPNEKEKFAAISETVSVMQQKHMTKNGGEVARGFHAKAHACVLGEFEVKVPDTATQAKVGLFAKDATYPVWVRFSNGVGFKQKDSKGDVRGLALKVMKVAGKKLMAGQEDALTQDFLTTNGAVTPAADAQQFSDFGKALFEAELAGEDPSLEIGELKVKFPGVDLGPLKTLFATGGYLLKSENKRVRNYLISTMLPRVLKKGSLAGEQFWSGGAIAMGLTGGDPRTARAAQAAKFTILPGVIDDKSGECKTVKKVPNFFDEDYLKTDITKRLASSTMCLDFQVQFQNDPQKQLIEDTSVEWRESDAPFVSVGMVRIAPTDLESADAEEKQAFCNDLGFTPWHALTDHRPLGNIMRARLPVYEASRALRGGADVEPTGDEFTP